MNHCLLFHAPDKRADLFAEMYHCLLFHAPDKGQIYSSQPPRMPPKRQRSVRRRAPESLHLLRLEFRFRWRNNGIKVHLTLTTIPATRKTRKN